MSISTYPLGKPGGNRMACVNALSGLSCYAMTPIVKYAPFMCQCPLGLIPHFYLQKTLDEMSTVDEVSMLSRAYTSFLLGLLEMLH